MNPCREPGINRPGAEEPAFVAKTHAAAAINLKPASKGVCGVRMQLIRSREFQAVRFR